MVLLLLSSAEIGPAQGLGFGAEALDRDDLLVPRGQIDCTVAEMASLSFLEDQAFRGPVGCEVHSIASDVHVDVALGEGQVLEWLGPIHVSCDQVSIHPDSCGQDMGFLVDVIDTACCDICGAVRTDLDSRLHELLLDLSPGLHRDESELDVGCEGFKPGAHDP